MAIKLKGGRVYDPANGVDGEVRDILVRDGRIVADDPSAKVDSEYDVSGRVDRGCRSRFVHQGQIVKVVRASRRRFFLRTGGSLGAVNVN